MALNRTQPLDERVKAFRAELDAFIDARVAEIRKTCQVPDGAVRNSLMRGMGCQCSAVLEIKRQDDAEQQGAA